MTPSIIFSLTLKENHLSTEMVRTKNYDSSAKLLNPSINCNIHHLDSNFTEIDPNAYCTPCDRIARFNAPYSAGLTMKEASKIAKHLVLTDKKANPKLIGVNLSATAPDAFEATTRINAIALSETGKSPPKRKKKEQLKPLPSEASTLALRDNHRMIRSKPLYSLRDTKPVPAADPTVTKNFDSWDPEAIDEPSADDFKDGSIGGATKFELKFLAMDKFLAAVDTIIHHGVITATGSGQRQPVSELKDKNMESIVSRIPAIPGFLNSDYLKMLLGTEMFSVKKEYIRANARASVLYSIKDPYEARLLEIVKDHLEDNSHIELWTNKEFQLKEWRVHRKTDIEPEAVLHYYQMMDRNLCNTLPIMLDLQYLWMDGSLPTMWWDNLPNSEPCSYNQLLFVDVNQPKFRYRLPFSSDDFATHIETYAKDIRDSLVEYWVVAAGSKLSSYISQLVENVKNLEESKDEDEIDIINELRFDEDEEEDEPSPFKRFKEKNAQKALTNRVALEGLKDKKFSSAKSDTQSDFGRKTKNRAESVVDCAVVLMSRQLRYMCESSLLSLTGLFEDLSKPATAQYSIFAINIRLRKIHSKEITTDFSEPVEVCLQPDLSEIHSTMINCITTIVNTSRNYARPEQSFGQSFGGANNYMVTDMLVYARHKKMNECSVALSDSIVHEVKDRINSTITRYYEAPEKLLERFSVLEKLLSGEKTEQVFNTIRESIGADDTGDALEKLGFVAKDLEDMIEAIKNMLPDICHFPMFEVRSMDLKELLIKQLRLLLSHVMDALVEENRSHMVMISGKYQDIANKLISEITDSAELRALQEFMNKAASTLSDLYDQYVSVCYERVKFILDHKHKLPREDIQVLYTTFNWPLNIQTYLRRAYESLSTRKKELEELLEEDQRRLENDVTDLFKRVELVADNGSPMEFRKNVERINMIKRDLEIKMERAEEITERETLLEVPHSDYMARLEEIKVNLDPLERLWITVKAFVEKTHHWHETKLSEIDPEEAERTSDEIYRTLIKSAKEFDKMGEKRQVAKRIAESLQGEVKEFMNESVPLMLLICNPGMQERHWNEIEALTGVRIPRGEVYTVNMMLELGLQHHVKAIEDICVSASKEYGLQLAMDKMEAEWTEMIFDTKEYRTSGTRILSGIDEIQQLLDDQIVKTQAMRGSRFIKPFLERITQWEQTLLAMQDIIDNWLKVQSTWLYLVSLCFIPIKHIL